MTASVVFGQPLDASFGRVGTAQLRRAAELPEPEPLAHGRIRVWRSERLARRLVGAPRLAAPACAGPPVAILSRARALELGECCRVAARDGVELDEHLVGGLGALRVDLAGGAHPSGRLPPFGLF